MAELDKTGLEAAARAICESTEADIYNHLPEKGIVKASYRQQARDGVCAYLSTAPVVAWRVLAEPNLPVHFALTKADAYQLAHNLLTYRKGCTKAWVEPLYAFPRPSDSPSATTSAGVTEEQTPRDELCSDCPPIGYPTDKTRCLPCPRRVAPVNQKEAVPVAWRYEIQHGPDGEANYAWVYDQDNTLVCTAKTHHAIAIVGRASGPSAKASVEDIARIISQSYGEDPSDLAPRSTICGPNNEPLPNWMTYEEQAKAVFTWMMEVAVPFAWTSLAGMKAIAEGREAFMFPASGDTAHLIPLYASTAPAVEPVGIKALREAAENVVNFAWSAVVTDCTESADYLNELITELRSALVHPTPPPVSAPVGENETIALLREVRTWIGDGENADDLGREIWTDAYADIVDRVDDVLARSPAVVEGK